MTEHILFLTGKLAEKRLHRVLESIAVEDFTYEIRNIGVNVASLMTAGMISRRLQTVGDADRVIVPGLCRGDLGQLTEKFAVPFVRGTDDLKDLPKYFGRKFEETDLSRHAVRIFAEIVDAAEITTEELVQRAMGFRAMQFNLVVSTNEKAVRLWEKHGFEIVGHLPGAFNHTHLGEVDAYVMYKRL